MLTHEHQLIYKHDPLVDADTSTSIQRHLNADSEAHTLRVSN
jgi:hypothetical protein